MNRVKQKIIVMGLGYIGLPTASMLATKGHQVVGVDVNSATVQTINAGRTDSRKDQFQLWRNVFGFACLCEVAFAFLSQRFQQAAVGVVFVFKIQNHSQFRVELVQLGVGHSADFNYGGVEEIAGQNVYAAECSARFAQDDWVVGDAIG